MSISDKFLNGFVTLRRLVYRLWKLCSILFIAKNCIWWAVCPIGPLFMKYIMGFFCLFVWGLQFFTYMETSPLPVKGFIATALKLLKRISCNTVAKLYILFTCAFSQEILNRELWRKYSFLCNLCETSLACVLYVNLNDREAVWKHFWQWMSKCYC